VWCFQLIAIGLASVLFVKYMAYDKSDTFSSSAPPTPNLASPTNARSPPNTAQSSRAINTGPHCPFTFPENPTPLQQAGSIVRRRGTATLPATIMGNVQGVRSCGSNLSAIMEKDTLEETRDVVSKNSQPPVSETKPASCSSVAIQTDSTSESGLAGSGRPMFTLGPGDRKTSVASSGSSVSGGEDQHRSAFTVTPEATPRDLDTCLELYKLDVSGCDFG